MRAFRNIMGIRTDRTKVSAARRRIVAAGLALGILAITAGVRHVSHADTSPAPPVSKCSDFGCEQ